MEAKGEDKNRYQDLKAEVQRKLRVYTEQNRNDTQRSACHLPPGTSDEVAARFLSGVSVVMT